METMIYVLVAVAVIALMAYVGLPRLLHALGLHPSYDMPKFDLAGTRAVVITTSHDKLEGTGLSTGVFGSEMTVPYYAFLDAGMEVDIASIKGGQGALGPALGLAPGHPRRPAIRQRP